MQTLACIPQWCREPHPAEYGITLCNPPAYRGQFNGSDVLRLAVLKYAAVLGAPYIDVEYLAAEFFFASAALTQVVYLSP